MPISPRQIIKTLVATIWINGGIFKYIISHVSSGLCSPTFFKFAKLVSLVQTKFKLIPPLHDIIMQIKYEEQRNRLSIIMNRRLHIATTRKEKFYKNFISVLRRKAVGISFFLALFLGLILFLLKKIAIHIHTVKIDTKVGIMVSQLPFAKVKALTKVFGSSIFYLLLIIFWGFELLNDLPLGEGFIFLQLGHLRLQPHHSLRLFLELFDRLLILLIELIQKSFQLFGLVLSSDHL